MQQCHTFSSGHANILMSNALHKCLAIRYFRSIQICQTCDVTVAQTKMLATNISQNVNSAFRKKKCLWNQVKLKYCELVDLPQKENLLSFFTNLRRDYLVSTLLVVSNLL